MTSKTPKVKEYGPGTRDNIVIGIDQSYTGFAITALDEYDGYYTTVQALPGKDVDRLHYAKSHVPNFIGSRTWQVLGVGMEGYAHGAKFGREIAGELGAAVKLGLYDWDFDMPLVIIPPSVLKKYVTGTGNAAKDQMMLHAYKKWGVEFDDNNACDSYCVARMILDDA